MVACSDGGNLTESGLDPAKFDTVINNKPVKLYTLKSGDMEVCITNFGGRVVSLVVPNKNGAPTDVVLGYDNIAQYADTVNSPSDFGAAIGRYANRIKDGKITLSNGTTIQLPRNNYGHCLHGGPSGWQYQVYDAEQPNDTTLKLVMHSPDGDNNFPGNVTATVTYTIKGSNTLDITFEGETDAETVLNMTNHSYFNLSGDPSVAGTNMELFVNANKYTPVDSTFMPTGEFRDVYGTPMDFVKKPHALYETIGDTTFQDIKYALGYDHNWVLNTYNDGKPNENIVAASLYSPDSGIFLQVYTNEPGIQVYSGNFLDPSKGVKGKKGIVYPQRASVCLETQKYPDSPNHKDWPSPWLHPGEKYYSHVAYKFSVK